MGAGGELSDGTSCGAAARRQPLRFQRRRPAADVIGSVPLLTDVLTGAGVGALVGGILAYRWERLAGRRDRQPAVEPRWIVTRWTWVGACVGLVLHVLARVL
jgi:hypothetical protein